MESEEYGTVLTPLTTPIFDFHQVGSAYYSDSVSVASENQPLQFAIIGDLRCTHVNLVL